MRFEHWPHTLRLRLRTLFRRQRVEAELDAELRYHLDQETDRLVADGLSPDEARRRAHHAIGGLELRKEECRDWRGVTILEHLWRDTARAFRALRRDLGFTLGTTSVLAIGIGANVAAFSIVNGILLRPLPFKDPDRLVTIAEVVPHLGDRLVSVNERHFLEWRACRCLDDVALSDSFTEVNLTGDVEAERVPFARVTPNLFSLLGTNAQLGRTLVPSDRNASEERIAVISDRLWRRRFGADPNVVGRTVGINGNTSVIVGVLPEGFRHFDRQGVAPDGRIDVYVPWVVNPPDAVGWAGTFNYAALGRLRPGVSVESAAEELDIIQAAIAERFPAAWQGFGLQARVVPLLEELTGGSRTGLLLVLAAIGAAFLVACVNIANLMLVRAAARRREVAVHIALGSSRVAIFRSLLVESAALALVGVVAGAGLAWASLAIFSTIAPADLPRVHEVRADWTVLAAAAGVGLTATAVFGLLPALRLTQVDPQASLLDHGRPATDSRGRLHQALVCAEVGLSACLMVVAGLLLMSFLRLQAVDRGFDATNVLTAELTLPPVRYGAPSRLGQNDQPMRFFDTLIERLESIPQIIAAGVTSRLPLRGNSWGQGAIPEGRQAATPGVVPPMEYRWVSPNYWKAMGIPLLAGRPIDKADRPGRVAVLSKQAARFLWPDEDPLGKRFSSPGSPQDLYEVVGVVPDVHATELTGDPVPLIYVPLWLPGAPVSSIAVRTRSDPIAVVGILRSAVASLDPGLPIANVQTMQEIDSASVAERRFQMGLTVAFAVASLLITALGTYGVLAYTVTQRRRELAVRAALGAWRGHLARLVFRRGLAPVIVGLGLGIATALAVGRALSSLLFQVTPADPVTVGAVSAVTLGAALLACWLPVRRAARASPLDALRSE